MLSSSTQFHSVSKKYGINILLCSCLILLIASIGILASVPPVSRDALTHHLAIPKLYIKHGGIYEIPHAKWSYYPMNLDLVYMIPLYFGNDIIPKFIHFAFALFTGWLIFSYLRRRTELFYAIIGAILFLSLPIIVKLSITVYVDLGLIFFSFAALIYLLQWLENDFRWRPLVASAVCCGLAIGTKYNGLIGLFILILFIAFIYSRSATPMVVNQAKSVFFSAVFMLIALVVFSPWAIRNYKWTDNPIYPLYNSWFNSDQAEPHKASLTESDTDPNDDVTEGIDNSKGRWNHFAVRKIIFNEKWWQIILIPVRIFFQGRDDQPKYFDGRLNPILFFLPFFAFINLGDDSSHLKSEKKIFLAYAVLFIIFAFLQRDMRIRYIGPAIPPLAILSMFGLRKIVDFIQNRFARLPKRIYLCFLGALLLFFFGLNLSYLSQQYRMMEPVRYLKGEIQRDAYIAKYRPEYAAIRFANQNLPHSATILGIFLGNRSYYSDLEMRFDFNTFILKAFRQKKTDYQILANFQNMGITHLLIRYDLFNSWVENNFDDTEKQRFRYFFNDHTSLIYAKNGHGLYRLESFNR